jgi:hypothetical protein
MKTILLLATVGILGTLPLVADEVVLSSGISAYDPGTSFVMGDTAGPVTYEYSPNVIYQTASGTVIPAGDFRTRVMVGRPANIHYVTVGGHRVIRRVVVDDDLHPAVRVADYDDDDDVDDDD